MEFSDTTLAPGQKEAGFLYFKLPADIARLDYADVIVQAVDEWAKNEIVFDFKLPLRASVSPTSGTKSLAE